VLNKSRLPNGASNFNQLVGDYTNPILKPQVGPKTCTAGDIAPPLPGRGKVV
jgi:hypothetical protein